MNGGIDALVLAGERPEGDPLARAMGVAFKAVIPVAGRPMVARVVETLQAHPQIGSVTVLTQRPDALAPLLPAQVRIEPSASTIAATVCPRLGDRPLLVTTADHPLLNAAMVDAFLHGAVHADVAAGLVERRTLMAHYPQSQRTWLKFRGGAYSGTNLFWLNGARARPLVDRWAMVEQQRKRGPALLGAFGPFILIGVAMRLFTLDGALARVGRRLGVRVCAVILPQAEACIDVDNLADHAQVEAILAG